MADKVIRWHIKGILSETGVVDTNVHGMSHRADKEYVIDTVHTRVKTAPVSDGTGIQFDINVDGVSIYGEDQEAVIPSGVTEAECDTFASPNPTIHEGEIITLDIDQVGDKYPGKDLVIELYLNELDNL